MQQINVSSSKRRYLIGFVVAAVAFTTAVYFFFNISRGSKPVGPPEKVTIAYATITSTALAIVAQMRGYYREEGLDVTARLHPYGKLALQDVQEGKADFATVAETPVMFAILNGGKISVVATIQTTNQTHTVIARRDRGIGQFEDLRGKKIAVTTGTTSDYFLNAILAAQGISRKDIDFVDLKLDAIPEALDRGDVDAASAFHPYNILAQKKLGDRGIAFHDKDIYTSSINMIAMQSFILRRPGMVVKLLRALVKAEEFVKEHPEEAQKIVADFNRTDIALVRDVWASHNFGVVLDQSLLLVLEDETKWAIRNRLTGGVTKIPNYLDFIYLDGLDSVKPKAIQIIR